jgi:hypothetical protein
MRERDSLTSTRQLSLTCIQVQEVEQWCQQKAQRDERGLDPLDLLVKLQTCVRVRQGGGQGGGGLC